MCGFDLAEKTPLTAMLGAVVLVATVLVLVILVPAVIGFGIAGASAAIWCIWLERSD
jgi:hypothetical protein